MVGKISLEFMNFTISLIGVSKDGELSLEKIKECVVDSFGEDSSVVLEAISNAFTGDDISIMDIIDIASTAVYDS